MARFLRTETNSSGGHSRLRPPPTIIGAGIAFHGPGVRLADPLSGNTVRGGRRARSRLSPPTVVNPAAAQPLARPIKTTLADTDGLVVRAHQREVDWKLGAPRVVTPDTFTPCAVVTDTFVRADEDPVANIWGESAAVGPTKTGRVLSNQFVPKAAETQGFAYLFQPVNVTGPFQVSMKFSYTTNVGTATLGVGDSATGVGRARVTVGKNDVQLFLFAVRVVTATRPIASGDSLALVVTPGSPNSTYDVFHKPGAGPWQKIISYVGSEITWASESVIRPFIVANDTAAINDFSFCPYTNDGVTPKLAPSSRGKAKSFIRAPVVVNAFVSEAVAEVVLAYSRRGTPKSKLAPPAVVTQIATQTFSGPKETLTRFARPTRTTSVLRGPTVINNPVPGGIGIRLAPSRRGTPKSLLRPIPVVTPAVTQTFTGPKETLARSFRGTAKSRLPEVVYDAKTYAPIEVRLAASKRGTPKSRLKPPVVIDLTPQTRFLSVSLSYSLRGKPRSFLGRPQDLVDAADFGFVRVHLAPQKRGIPKSRLFAPAVVAPVLARAILKSLVRIRPPLTDHWLRQPLVVNAEVSTAKISVHLAPSKRGVPKSKLGPPAFVGAPGPADAVADVTLTYSSRGKPKSRLSPPAVVAPVLAAPVVVTLTYSSRGKAKPKLSPPTVVQAFRIPVVNVALAPSSRGVPKSILRKPTDLVDQQDLGSVRVHLAYSSRGKAKSKLRTPAVVTPVLASPIATTLAPQKRGIPKSRLTPPTVVVASSAVRPIVVHLAYSRRGKPLSGLGKPVVLDSNTAYPQGPMVQLTYSSRGKPTSVLRGPTVINNPVPGGIGVRLAPSRRGTAKSFLRKSAIIDLRPQAYFLTTSLAYSVRGKPKSRLTPASLFTPVAKAETTLAVTLAYSLRGKAKSRLGKPVVVAAATPYFRDEPVTLAYSSRGEAKPRLGLPIVVNQPRPFFGPTVKLAPSKRGKAKSRLLGVIYGARVFAPIRVRLAPKPRTRAKSKLSSVVYAARVYAPIRVELAPSSRLARAPHSRLEAPTVVATFVARPTRVVLAYSRRGRPFSELRPPTRVAPVLARHIQVTLAPQRRGKPYSKLRPPVVVTPAFFARPIEVTLVRIRPPRIHSLLARTATVFIAPGGGDCQIGDYPVGAVSGGDDAGPGGGVSGGDSTPGSVSGGDTGRSGGYVSGGDSAPGSVSGSDERIP